jgi:enoyl-CoA hydratase/carnithine racemase
VTRSVRFAKSSVAHDSRTESDGSGIGYPLLRQCALTESFDIGDVTVNVGESDFVATVTIRRPPENYFDADLIGALADAYRMLDEDVRCRALVLKSEGKHFCAGAQLGGRGQPAESIRDLYSEAARLFNMETPVVAAIQGAAIGGGLGLALSADFRVGSPSTRMSANFARLGFHHGFGLSITLPEVVGQQRALELLLIGERLEGQRCFEIGLLDRLVADAEVDEAARSFAAGIAASAPIAARDIRATMRAGMAERVREAMRHEQSQQDRHQRTDDFREGIRAALDRRSPRFTGS